MITSFFKNIWKVLMLVTNWKMITKKNCALKKGVLSFNKNNKQEERWQMEKFGFPLMVVS